MVYISPENSTYSRRSKEDILSLVKQDICKFQKDGDIMLLGDMNARTGTLGDFISDDSGQYLPVANDIYTQDIPLKPRVSQDIHVNDRGNQLIDLCISSQLRIMNGRTLGDLLGLNTCHKHNGSSLVDYCIADESLVKSITCFKVHDHLSDLSDHNLISCLVKQLNYRPTKSNNILLTPAPKKIKWDKSLFLNAIKNEELINELSSFNNECITDIDVASSKFSQMISSKIIAALPRTQTRTPRSDKYKSQKWYNSNLRNIRNTLTKYGKLLRLNPYDKTLRLKYFSILKLYRKKCKLVYRSFKNDILDKLDSLHENSPEEYWKLVSNLRKSHNAKSVTNNITPATWFEHFKNLNNNSTVHHTAIHAQITEDLKLLEKRKFFNNLDNIITEDEIIQATNLLKCKKSPGPDLITNDILKGGQKLFCKSLHRLFNAVLSNGIYPNAWALGHITAIHKKGSTNDPNNYRGITISSAVGKLFNSILNNRLTHFLNDNQILCDEQIGFRKKCRTTDHLFILKSILDHHKKKKKTLYICFVDFAKAFDRVWHDGLFYKMQHIGIPNRFYNIIKNMYSKIGLQVKINNQLTPLFRSMQGVRQGDNLSPTLFNIVSNDIPRVLTDCDPVKYGKLKLHCLAYADDLVVLSQSTVGMQKALNSLSEYCKTWKFEINIQKTKIMYFNVSCPNKQFMYNNDPIEYTNEYQYLGIKFSNTCNFKVAMDELYKKALKVYHTLMKSLNPYPSIKTCCHLFDHLIQPIILYGCEIWGPVIIKQSPLGLESNFWKKLHSSFPIEHKFCSTLTTFERLHIKFCRDILGVNCKTTSIGVYGDLGRFPLYINVIKRCEKYLQHLRANTNNSLLRKFYDVFTIENNNCRAPNIITFVDNINRLLGDRSTHQRNLCIALQDNYQRYWREHISTMESRTGIGHNKLRTYNSFKTHFGRESYLTSIISRENIKAIARLRLSSHKLKIESHRYNSKNNYVPPEDRKCTNCDSDSVENELHFLIECPYYNEARQIMYNVFTSSCAHFESLSNNNKFIYIMSHEDRDHITSLGNYLKYAMSIRG